MQPYTAWPSNNGSLTITLNIGTFASSASAYLYLCNASDVCSAGHAVTLGGGGGTPTAPTNLRIVPGDVGLLLAGFASLAVSVAPESQSVLRGAGELTRDRQNMTRVVAFLSLLTLATSASAQAPAITSHSGGLTHGSSVTLTVTGAGTKSQNTQLLWDP